MLKQDAAKVAGTPAGLQRECPGHQEEKYRFYERSKQKE